MPALARRGDGFHYPSAVETGERSRVPAETKPPPEAFLAVLLLQLSSAFFGCALGSVVPLLNTEVLIFGLALATPAWLGWPLVLMAAAGTMLGKLALYLAGKGVLRLRIRGRDRIEKWMAEFERKRGVSGSLLFVSAASGFPPFYFVTVAAGAMGMAVSRFLVIGFVGRFVRFAAVVFVPHLFKELVG